jgi:hypothetical protein
MRRMQLTAAKRSGMDWNNCDKGELSKMSNVSEVNILAASKGLRSLDCMPTKAPKVTSGEICRGVNARGTQSARGPCSTDAAYLTNSGGCDSDHSECCCRINLVQP